ncbi:MAG: acylphosphatase [Candidatus Nanoarchaeia archaeon]|nr:acylphosphatase [Candidatus Nanoarchaeia archaeon]MDD5239495.1 acylphosphatase [Candidatus Nanoarchaeia archaeon]
MRIHCFVSGKVQKVFFRDYTVESAKETNILGWVKNLSDGRVEIVAEGSPVNLIKFVALIKKGPKEAKVDEIEMEEEAETGKFRVFEQK